VSCAASRQTLLRRVHARLPRRRARAHAQGAQGLLLDQTKVTGLGNIYAAEVLHLARVNPFAVAAHLPRRRVTRLHRAIVEVLSESIRHGSTMNVDPENIDGSYFTAARYDGRWRVYDREGEPCPRAATPVRRVSHAGRSTYFCPRCQSVSLERRARRTGGA
jgi:formamidopyrimidine-DNA glycosylase